MHSVTPYLLRSYKQRVEANYDYHKLSSVNSHDLFELIKEKLTALKKDIFINNEDAKQIYRVSNLQVDPTARTISAWFEMGRYGNKSQIINYITGNLEHDKTEKDADVNKHFVIFHIPMDEIYGFAVVHGIANTGVKTLVYNELSTIFRSRTQQVLNMNIASHKQVANAWSNAVTKEIILKGFNPSSDIADGAKDVPASEDYKFELSIKPKRGKSLPFLSDLRKKGNALNDFLEIIHPDGYLSETKITLENNGKKRTFNLNKNIEDQMSSIEIDDSVVTMIDGNPEFFSLQAYSLGVIEDLKKSVKP